MADFLTHTTKDGERWCDVAQQRYGKASLMNIIIEDNPDVPRYDILPAGTILKVRIIERVEVETTLEKLVPWK